MVAVTIDRDYLARVGRLVGKIFETKKIAGVNETTVANYLGISMTTWNNVKNGTAGTITASRVLNDAEKYVDGILNK
ncbi:hypothetical protein WOSG25_180190 [Weissella oryzae SG25]|uniref:Uncharacterized protein n=1 Tax=Weissella oryzae (strain DSM 25784 / JCM 18191 / LMG 30913 / SG25) TaxID=1329250 RepID=A0A069CXD2_WEIOS|nr:hypothetical protein [Weissella oryzae]GAK31868.1 hypothetical protein WOSG25_180190 [Weissella oryzae SG25]